MKYFFYIIMFFVCGPVPVCPQNNIAIFADVKGNDTLQKLVAIFSEQLKKGSPDNFSVQPTSSYKGKGFYLSTAIESQKVKPSVKLRKAGIEAFSVDANDQTVQILGNCDMAIGHGIFSYLEFIGYRYYFANPDWYIIPSNPVLFRKWNIVSAPSFSHRRIFYGYGTGSATADADFIFWYLANKMGGSMNAYFGHAYEDIISRHTEVFSQHPEWFYPVAPKGVIPENAKFDMTKDDLVQLITEDVEKRIGASLKNKTNDYKMISLGPSDGTGTCNSPACQKLGTYTDRVYYLTNRVAKAIQKKYPLTLIGCLAYGEYISPPSKKVEPNVFVGITTAFNVSKYTTDQLVDEWKKKGALVGIYDYFSWYAWDFDIPGQSLASRSGEIVNNIKKYHAKRVTAYEGESSIGWINKGLGYYLTAKQMWDVHADAMAAKKEFFRLCFGKASDAMQKLWSKWESYSFTSLRENALATWIDDVTAAEKMEKDEKVNRRMFQVKSYLHWLSLYRNYLLNKTEAGLILLMNFGYRKLDDGSVSGFPAFFVVGGTSGFPGMGFAEKPTWKNNNSPVTAAEIDRLLKEDRTKLKISDPVKEFFPAKKFYNVPDLARYSTMTADSVGNENTYCYTNEWIIEIKNKGAANYIDFIGDFVGNPTVTRPIKISIYPYTANGNISGQPLLLYYEYKATLVKEKVSMEKLTPGYYTLIIEDPVKIFKLSFSPAINFSMIMRPERQIRASLFNYAFIYVPEGVKRFNVIKSSLLEFITPTGRKVSYKNDKVEDVQIDVLKGEAGLWRFKPLYHQFFAEGIPPYIGTSPKQMLIPAGIK